jgi:uncharacterized tellurite resistance protein B-like protein
MGLFDDALGGVGGKEAFGPADGFAAILLSAVACDGHISDEEVHGLFTISERMKLFENVKGNKWNRMMDRLLGILKRSGVDTLIDKGAAALPEELKETAFAVACELVLADQGIEDEEKEYLSKLQEKLEIEREQAIKIFKVMVVKNSG